MNNKLNRRDFMKLLMGSSALGTMGQLPFMQNAYAGTPSFSDYKAIVCIFLYGGNDSYSMLIPLGDSEERGYQTYQGIRGTDFEKGLAVSNTQLTPPPDGTNPYYESGGGLIGAYKKGLYSLESKGINLGVNGMMPELYHLFDQNKASVVGNIGSLVEPVTREQIKGNYANLPLFLFAHNHQQRILQTGQADKLGTSGWAGRLADQWQGINNASSMGMNISYGGISQLLEGNSSSPITLGTSSIPRFTNLIAGTNAALDDRIALYHAMMGIGAEDGYSLAKARIAFDGSMTHKYTDPFHKTYGALLKKSHATFSELYDVWQSAENEITYSSRTFYDKPLFDIPAPHTIELGNQLDGHLIGQLSAVAKMIKLGSSGKFYTGPFNRQIFFVKMGGFDNHSHQAFKHSTLLRELSLGLESFQKAMEEFGLENNVTAFTMSDFGRSLSNNGGGTDHAWASQQLIIGGDGNSSPGNIKGGVMHGDIPDLRLAGVNDHGQRGRYIPDIAQEQLSASLCQWFGADETTIEGLFPNLKNFRTDSNVAASAYLQGVFV